MNSLGQLKAKAKKKSSLVSGNRSGENFFITHPLAYSNVHQNIYFLIKKKTEKKQQDQKKKKKKKKKLKEKRDYRWIIQRDTMILFANLLYVILTYLIESWIFHGCSYELNVVFEQHEKSEYLLYNNCIWSAHF